MAAGNFNGDSYDDLAIATPGRDILGQSNAGAVTVLYGDVSGLQAAGSQWLHQGLVTISDVPDPFDAFGGSLAVGNFDGDAYDDLAIGVVFEDIGGKAQSGAAHVVYGGVAGLYLLDDEFLHQDVAHFPDGTENYDFFAYSLAAADFDDDGLDDLAVGVAGESYFIIALSTTDAESPPGARQASERPQPRGGPILGPGMVHIVFSNGDGLMPEAAKPPAIWRQTSDGVAGEPAANNLFGYRLAAADFNGDGRADLAIDSLADEVEVDGVVVALGSVVVLTSDIFSDGFEFGDITSWSATTP